MDSRSRRGWRAVAVDAAVVGTIVAWVAGAGVTHRTAPPDRIAQAHPAHAVSVSDPLGAFNPVGRHGALDCGSYLDPLVRSLRAVHRTVARHLDRTAYEAAVSIELTVYSRSNFAALDRQCATRVASPAAAASHAYAAADVVWSRCAPAGCEETRLAKRLHGRLARADRDVARAIAALDRLERASVGLRPGP